MPRHVQWTMGTLAVQLRAFLQESHYQRPTTGFWIVTHGDATQQELSLGAFRVIVVLKGEINSCTALRCGTLEFYEWMGTIKLGLSFLSSGSENMIRSKEFSYLLDFTAVAVIGEGLS